MDNRFNELFDEFVGEFMKAGFDRITSTLIASKEFMELLNARMKHHIEVGEKDRPPS